MDQQSQGPGLDHSDLLGLYPSGASQFHFNSQRPYLEVLHQKSELCIGPCNSPSTRRTMPLQTHINHYPHAPRALHPKYHLYQTVGMPLPQYPGLPRQPTPNTDNSACTWHRPSQARAGSCPTPKDPRLTTGAVGSSPAGLTVAGVRGNTAAVHTLLCTQGCRRPREREKDQEQTVKTNHPVKEHKPLLNYSLRPRDAPNASLALEKSKRLQTSVI